MSWKLFLASVTQNEDGLPQYYDFSFNQLDVDTLWKLGEMYITDTIITGTLKYVR